ncbi:MAG: hypothetical protein QOD86_1723 [Miltoncostaeaceae bacterium]|nr:hypothetical protein [Miltoncostaeaceae bacterium]
MVRSGSGGGGSSRARRRASVALIVAAAALGVPAAAAAWPLDVVYTGAPAAAAINDGAEGLPGLKDAFRQAPILDDARWPSSRRMGKVSGDELAHLPTPEAMATRLAYGWQTITAGGATTAVGGRVGVDEITPSDWTPDQATKLGNALDILGVHAERVIFYASPSLVEQVGRRDPRKPLPRNLAALVDALSRGGHLYLETYRGNLQPFPLRQMANHLTRWWDRWPESRREHLHVIIGPSGWSTQSSIWNRVRSTAAGREILANGVGAFGLKTHDDGLAFLAEYRTYQASPLALPPSGDARLAEVGGVRIMVRTNARLALGSTFKVRISRPGNAIVLMRPVTGKRRVVGRIAVRSSKTASIRIPERIAPGRWRIMVFMQGEGIKDKVFRNVLVVRPSKSLEHKQRRTPQPAAAGDPSKPVA